MFIIAQLALEELKKIPGFEDAVIAGGCCRDYKLGSETFKDIDFFVPLATSGEVFLEDFFHSQEKFDPQGYYTFGPKFSKMEATEINDLKFKLSPHQDYRSLRDVVSIKFDGKFLDNCDIQIMMCKTKDKGLDFIQQLFDNFNFNMNKIAWDGTDFILTKEFEEDLKFQMMTYVSYDGNPQALVRAVEKYLSVKKKHPHVVFNHSFQYMENNESKQSTLL